MWYLKSYPLCVSLKIEIPILDQKFRYGEGVWNHIHFWYLKSERNGGHDSRTWWPSMVMHSRTSAWKPCCWMCWIIDFNETICFNPMAMLDDTDHYITKQKKYRHDVYSSIRHRLGFPESTLQVLKSYPPSSDVGDHPKTLSDMILDPRKIIRQNYLDHTGCRIVHNCDKLRQTRLGFPESTLQVLKSYPPSSDVGDHPKTLSDMILDPRKIIRQNYLDHTGCRIVHNCNKLRQTRLGFPESTPQVLKSYPPSSDVGDHPKTLSDMILDPRKIIRQNYLDHTGCRIVHNCDTLRQTKLGFPESTLQVFFFLQVLKKISTIL